MKNEELKTLIEKYTVEDVLNHDELNKAINAQFDTLIDTKVSKAKENAMGGNIEAFIKEQGFENIDQFNSFVKNSKATSTELTEKVTRYETELEALRNDNTTLKSANENYTYSSKLSDVDDKYKKFVMSEIKGLVNDDMDFDTAKEKYLTDNAHYLRDKTEKIVTKLPKGGEQAQVTDGVAAILERKHGIKLE